MNRRIPTLAALAIAPALLLTACGSSGSGDAASEETITVTDMTGEVEIPAEPQAALGMYTTDVDILVTLGYPLADTQPVRDGYSAFPAFFPAEVEGLDTFANYPEFNYEAILAAGPDFILNGLGYEPEVVAKLPEIAPTFSFNGFDGRDWREIFHETAVALDREDAYQAWVDSYDARVVEVKEALAAAGVAPVVAPVGYWDGQVNVSCYGVPCLVFTDLGLEISPLTLGNQEGTTLSLEQVSELGGVDVFFTTGVPDAEGVVDNSELDPLADNTLWTALPAIANDAVYSADMETLFGSPSGHSAYLEFVAASLLGEGWDD